MNTNGFLNTGKEYVVKKQDMEPPQNYQLYRENEKVIEQTTYIIRGFHRQSTQDTLQDRIRGLILREAEKAG